MKHLLVTNDFPPKVGGIQSYLWELWRRLDVETFAVLTTPYAGMDRFDAEQPFEIIRDPARVLLPTRAQIRRVNEHAARIGADLVLLDPVLPIGFIGPRLDRPYGVVVHGAEVTVAAQSRIGRAAMSKVLRGAQLVVAAGSYPAAEAVRVAGRPLPSVVVPPGVDIGRFRPLDIAARREARCQFGLPIDAPVVVSVSRLVPRKGMDVLIEASARLRATFPDLVVAVGGTGRDRRRLERLVHDTDAPVRFLGKVADEDLPTLYGSADVFAMLCRNRWAGLEQEGFGIVFLEAAACGVAQIAGDSGGVADAVVDGTTGLVVTDPRSIGDATAALRRILGNDVWRRQLGDAARDRAVEHFAYPVLATSLAASLGCGTSHDTPPVSGGPG